MTGRDDTGTGATTGEHHSSARASAFLFSLQDNAGFATTIGRASRRHRRPPRNAERNQLEHCAALVSVCCARCLCLCTCCRSRFRRRADVEGDNLPTPNSTLKTILGTLLAPGSDCCRSAAVPGSTTIDTTEDKTRRPTKATPCFSNHLAANASNSACVSEPERSMSLSSMALATRSLVGASVRPGHLLAILKCRWHIAIVYDKAPFVHTAPFVSRVRSVAQRSAHACRGWE